MLSKGTNINVIQQVLGHSDPSVTKRFYADVRIKNEQKYLRVLVLLVTSIRYKVVLLIMYQSLNGSRLIRISVLQVCVMVIVQNLLQMEISVRDFLKDRNAILAVVISQHQSI